MINEEKLDQVLTLMFHQVKVPEHAKTKLRARIFGSPELSDEELGLVAAAGDPAQWEKQKHNKNNKEE